MIDCVVSALDMAKFNRACKSVLVFEIAVFWYRLVGIISEI